MNLPPIGWRVLWYPNADVRVKPQVADVTDVHPNGSVDLSLVPTRGGECSYQRGVRHASDPVLQENPTFRNKTGGWDWVPGLVFAAPEAPPATAPPADEPVSEELTERIFEMHTAGKTPKQIALAIGTKGVTADRVKKVIDSLVTN